VRVNTINDVPCKDYATWRLNRTVTLTLTQYFNKLPSIAGDVYIPITVQMTL